MKLARTNINRKTPQSLHNYNKKIAQYGPYRQRRLHTIIPKVFAHVVLCRDFPKLQQEEFFTVHCACHEVILLHWCSGAGYNRDIAGAVSKVFQNVDSVGWRGCVGKHTTLQWTWWEADTLLNSLNSWAESNIMGSRVYTYSSEEEVVHVQ